MSPTIPAPKRALGHRASSAYVDACAKECEATGKESYADNEGLVGHFVGGPRLDR